MAPVLVRAPLPVPDSRPHGARLTLRLLAIAAVLSLGWAPAAVAVPASDAPSGAPARDAAAAPAPTPAPPAPDALAASPPTSSPPAPNPIPVLLVPGWLDDATTLTPLRDRFIGAGWPETHVAAITFSNATGSNEAHALEIAQAAALLKALTGAERIDIVAHSMGGLATREWLRRMGEARTFGGGEVPVRRVVFLGTPHRGTVVASLSWGDGGREMIPGSFFLTRLNTAPPVPDGVEALAIRTPVDTRVIPASSGELRGDGVQNLELCCPTHPGLVDDDRTFAALLAFLVGGDEGRE